MKKNNLLPLFFILPFSLFPIGNTDVSLFSKISSSYNSAFYPGAVEYAEKLEKDFPSSAFIGKTLLIKGISLYNLDAFEKAESELLKAKKFFSDEKIAQNDCDFWLSKVYENEGNEKLALQGYYNYCKKSKNSAKYYDDALLCIGKLLYKNDEYEKSLPFFEYIIKNENKFKSNYNECLFNLMDCYNNTNNETKTINLYEKALEKRERDAVSSLKWQIFSFYAADAYNISKQYKKAFDIYSAILKSGEKSLVSNALKKAYNVSSKHKNEVGQDAVDVLKESKIYLKDSPELLSEFWSRLGSDAFFSGEYKKALDCFDEAEKNASLYLFLFALLYRAEIAAGKTPTIESACLAEKMITTSRAMLNEENSRILYRESNILLCRYAALQHHWNDAIKYSENVIPKDKDTKYYKAVSLYNTKNYEMALALLREDENNLSALTYIRLGNEKKAIELYKAMNEKGTLDDEAAINYMKVLFSIKDYENLHKIAQKCVSDDAKSNAKYIEGLAFFNEKKLNDAEKCFSEFLQNRKNDEMLENVSFAYYYLAVSQKLMGKTKEAISNFNFFSEKFPTHEFYWASLMSLTNCFVQTKENENAIRFCKKAIDSSKNDKELNEAVFLLADIYNDAKDFASSIELLKRYSDKFLVNDKIAEIYEKNGDIENAFKYYEKSNSEDALYRSGEMFFKAKNYEKAIVCFSDYTKMNPNGKIDSSVFYIAECYVALEKDENAILQNVLLLKKFPKSSYAYESEKNLITLYRKKKNYKDALKCANNLLEKYSIQAKDDDIETIKIELSGLLQGKTEEIVNKETDFSKYGKYSTVQGRKNGTELVALYSQFDSFEKDAVSMAEKLLEKQNEASESLWMAENSLFLAKYYRKTEKDKNAAEMFLNAAKYFKMNEKSDEVAMSLYGAWDAFRAAKMNGDAFETAKQLKEMYPESEYARAIEKDL